VAEALDALDPRTWRITVAEEQTRAVAGADVDAVMRATHR
jgi:hypothetical protein